MGYEWDFGDNSPHSAVANPDHTYSAAGNYTACVTLFGVCDTVVYCLDISTGPVGMSEVSSMGSILLYPNPVQDLLQVRGFTGTVQYTLYTYTGAVAARGTLELQRNSISMKTWATGLYYLEIRTGAKTGPVVFPVIKQ